MTIKTARQIIILSKYFVEGIESSETSRCGLMLTKPSRNSSTFVVQLNNRAKNNRRTRVYDPFCGAELTENRKVSKRF